MFNVNNHNKQIHTIGTRSLDSTIIYIGMYAYYYYKYHNTTLTSAYFLFGRRDLSTAEHVTDQTICHKRV